MNPVSLLQLPTDMMRSLHAPQGGERHGQTRGGRTERAAAFAVLLFAVGAALAFSFLG